MTLVFSSYSNNKVLTSFYKAISKKAPLLHNLEQIEL